jgi:hypothetical protein
LENNGKIKMSKARQRQVLTGLAVLLVIIILLFHRPAAYQPVYIRPDNSISTYLTNELLPRVYNGVQYGEPFDLVITQEGINDVVGRYKGGGKRFSRPMVVFSPGRAVLMGTVNLGGLKFIAGFSVEPEIDMQGYVNLKLRKVKIGAVSITPFGKRLAGRMFGEQISAAQKDAQGIEGLMVRMVLNNEPAEPVFDIEDKKVKLEKITVEEGKVTIRLLPVKEPKG